MAYSCFCGSLPLAAFVWGAAGERPGWGRAAACDGGVGGRLGTTGASSSNPAGFSTTVNAVNSVATFIGLTFTEAGTYTLTASSPGLGTVTSQSFAIAGTSSLHWRRHRIHHPWTERNADGIRFTLYGYGQRYVYDGVTVLGIRGLSGGKALLSTILPAAGSRSLKAYYGGDSIDLPARSAGLTQTISTAPSNGFRLPVGYFTDDYASAAAPLIADFNGDVKPDVAFIAHSQGYGSNLYVLLGNGDGTFQAPIITL